MISKYRIWLNDTAGVKLPDGEYKKFYWGDVVAIHTWVLNGEFHGSYTRYYSHGSKHEEFNFENGKKVGDFKIYHPSGRVKMEGTLLIGGFENWEWTYNNRFTEYYDVDNRIKRQGDYINGKKEGKHIFLSEDESHRFESNYKNGKRHGIKKETSGNAIKSLDHFYEDHIHGESLDYYYSWEGSGLRRKKIYKMGLLCEFWEYDKTRKLSQHKKYDPPIKEVYY